MKLAPGDAISSYMDPNVSIEDLAILRNQLGLDQPILIQYFKWLIQTLKGNLGFSIQHQQPVLDLILSRLPATLLLSITSLVCILTLAIPLGIISGYLKNRKVDHSITIFAFLGMSIPSFWLGLMLILIMSSILQLLPSSGIINPLLIDAALFTRITDISIHLILPVLTITIGGLAGLTRYIRFDTISVLNQDFITALKARGLSNKRILFKHTLKNTLLPLITLLGLELPGLFTGSYIIEYIFSWPGMGQLGLNAVFSRDYPLIMGILLFTGGLIIIGNLIADFTYSLIDPRIQTKKIS